MSQVDRFVFPDGHGVIVLASGRWLNLGCASGHPDFVISCSFTNQVLAPLDSLIGNSGHFDNIGMAGLEKLEGIQVENMKRQVDRFVFQDGHRVIVLASGRQLNLGCDTGHPSCAMPSSCTNQGFEGNQGLQDDAYLRTCFQILSLIMMPSAVVAATTQKLVLSGRVDLSGAVNIIIM